jgi:hypothetical protein
MDRSEKPLELAGLNKIIKTDRRLTANTVAYQPHNDLISTKISIPGIVAFGGKGHDKPVR